MFDASARLFPRGALDEVGIAPLTSMFQFDSNDRVGIDDYRPAVHDSDGLGMINGRGEQIWRPLSNPSTVQESGFEDMSEMTGKRIYEYKIHRRDVGDVNSVTLSNQLSTFRVFLRFCEKLDFVEKGTAESVMMPDIDPGENARDIAIDSETAEEILDYLTKFEYATLRHALFYVLWHTGMRTGSVHSLDLDDYYPEEQYLEVRHRPEQGTRPADRRVGRGIRRSAR